MAGSSESAFLFLDTKNGAIAPVVIIHLLLQQPLIIKYKTFQFLSTEFFAVNNFAYYAHFFSVNLFIHISVRLPDYIHQSCNGTF